MFEFRLPWIPTAMAAVLLCAPVAFADAPEFGGRVDLGVLEHDPIDEASGLVASRQNPDVFWTHNDSGDAARLYAFSSDGSHLGVYSVAGAAAFDWEDLAIGPGPTPGQQYLYVGDIGDNFALRSSIQVYRVPEPMVDAQAGPVTTTLSGAESITLQYPDGARDAETLMVDPVTRDLYLVTKREAAVRVYRAAYPQPTSGVVTLESVTTLDITQATAGGISPSGDGILIKTYSEAFHWCRGPGQGVGEALAGAKVTVPYVTEPQGEAIAWDAGGLGYFTVSEEPGGIPARLYSYPRIPTSVDVPAGSRGPTLEPTFPNPSNPRSQVRYRLPEAGLVSVVVYDAHGRRVRTLVERHQAAGRHQVLWRGENDAGYPVASGVYHVVVRAGGGSSQGKVTLLR